jgi:hypothetical protein
MRPDREDIYSQLPTLGRAAIGFGECRRSKCRIQMVAERAFLDIAVLRELVMPCRRRRGCFLLLFVEEPT